MDVVLHRPRGIRVRFARNPPETRRRSTVWSVVDLVARGFLMGEAIGMLTLTQHQPVVSVTVVGIVALGVALISWDR
jgi:hypothetical protein